MNAVFAAVFILSAALFLFSAPEAFLPALLAGGEKAATLSLALLSSYCVWLGFFKVLEKSGLSQKLARLVRPAARRLFRSRDETALALAAQNLSANLLGLPGAPTPLGVKATARFEKNSERYASDMLFVLNATSLQLLPATVLTLRLAAGSHAFSDILLPTLLSTLFSTLCGALLLILFSKKRPRSPKTARPLKKRAPLCARK